MSTHLNEHGVPHTAFRGTLQDFVEQDAQHWTVVQATYSIQSIPPAERPALFRWLRAHTQKFVLIEFDVPAFRAMYAPERVRYVVEQYERGLAEYVDDEHGVAQGFLLPVLFGSFDQSAARTNYEQPLNDWKAELMNAGFQSVEARELYRYWWAPAFILEAT